MAQQGDEKTKEKVRKSLRYSVYDGASAASMIGFGESFFVPFAVFLGASNIQLGLIGSLPQALGSVLQLFSNGLIRFVGSRKRLVASAALLQGMTYAPVALVYFLGGPRVYYLLFFMSLYWAFGMILGPAWNSWMGDLTDEEERGSYFGRRSKITGFSTFVSFLAAGYILQRFAESGEGRYAGFAVIFGLALVARLFSFSFLNMKYEPAYAHAREAEFSLLDFVKQAGRRNYGLFVLYLCLMNFSVYLSAPFFTPYMLKDLGFDYLTFTGVNAAAIIVKLISMPVWGHAADRFGTKKVLALTGFMMPIVPLMWLFSGDAAYLVPVQVYSGFIWGGFEIAAFNFIFDATTPMKRATCVAYYNVINGIAVITGAMAGGLMVRYNEVFHSKYLFVFLMSFLFRSVASLVFLPRLKEARAVEDIAYPRLFFKVISTMPTTGLVYGVIPFLKPKKEEER